MRQCIYQFKHKPISKPHDNFEQKYGYTTHYVMVQMSTKQGLKEFGNWTVNAIKAEFHQLLHDVEVFTPQCFHKLIYEQKRKALKNLFSSFKFNPEVLKSALKYLNLNI